VFLPLLLLCRRRGLGVALPLAFYVAFCFAAWFGLTHRADRFLAPAVPALAALGGLGVEAVRNGAGRSVCLAFTLALAVASPSSWYRYVLFERSLASALGESPETFFEDKAPQFRYGFKAMQWINDPANVPLDAKFLFFPEARTFWCKRDVVANTPFDRSLLAEILRRAETPEDVAGALRRRGITHVLINHAELYRLTRTTGGFEYGGRVHSHVLDGFKHPRFRSLFFELRDQHLDRLQDFGPSPKKPVIEVFRLKPPRP
jgi:hypothetical protein